MQQVITLTKKYWIFGFLGLLAIYFLFLRLYQIEARNQFTWDQIDNAWAAKHIIVDHQLPLLGMQAKAKTGFFIGPLYYYFITPFYFAFNLDPVASGVIAAFTSLIGAVVIFFVTKKMFSTNAAVFAVILLTVSSKIIELDRVQWPVQFIPILSLLAFYFLYKIISGNSKYILYLALIVGLGFHIHFTLIVFLPIIVLLCLPFFPKKKETLLYGLFGVLAIFVFLIPNIIVEVSSKNEHTKNMVGYLQANFHGFHPRRFIQVTQDALIQIEEVFVYSFLKPLKFILIPLTILVGFFVMKRKEWGILSYLLVLWFLVPWIIFAMYKSEISDYYFLFNRYVVILVCGFLLAKAFSLKTIFPKLLVVAAILYFSYLNFVTFITTSSEGDIARRTPEVMREINKAGYFPYGDGDIKSYLFYAYSWEKFKRRAY